MKSLLNRVLLVAAAGALVLTQAAAAAGNLIDTRSLSSQVGAPDLVILDAQPRPMHAKGHIPGAVSVDVMALASFGLRDLSLPDVERMLRSYGVDSAKRIVIYDQGATWFAARLFYSLQYYGFPVEKMALLDGGFAKWQADGLAVTKDPTPAPAAGSFSVASVNDESRSRPPEFVAATGDRGKVLLDAMGPEFHYGGSAFFNKAGHIPHAVNLPTEDLFNADKTFKSPAEIRKMAEHVGIRPDQEVHSHCGGGGTAAVPYFALKHIAGYSKVKLSVESQLGWLQDDRELPFWTYAAPGMMRDTDWLAAWGGRMMRMYGVSKVSVVDVRAPAAYAQGHVPFALNVPGETFRGNAKDPRKLAEVLGASGVDPSHEAVVVSGGGVTKDAALAYVMLERLGQKRVSIFIDSLDSIDSLDKMSRVNFAVVKDATVVGKPAKPTDMAVAPAKYVADLRQDQAGGAYPKVYIASGAVLPVRAVQGKVVHVPYTELLKPDGTPKAAKEIWTVLQKAGVPRYAELVTISDDPGEAAANYFVLKLMGYPDIKINGV